MPAGILKYMKTAAPDLHWGRADYDGIPFRGKEAPLLREHEYEQRAVRVCDADVRTFDMSNPEDHATYREILDRTANGWYVILDTHKNWDPDKKCMIVYVEWVARYIEDSQSYMRGSRR